MAEPATTNQPTAEDIERILRGQSTRDKWWVLVYAIAQGGAVITMFLAWLLERYIQDHFEPNLAHNPFVAITPFAVVLYALVTFCSLFLFAWVRGQRRHQQISHLRSMLVDNPQLLATLALLGFQDSRSTWESRVTNLIYFSLGIAIPILISSLHLFSK